MHFTKIKLCWPRLVRAVLRSGLDRFQPAGGRFEGDRSCRAQIGQPFQFLTDAFELQFQTVGPLAHIPYSPITRAPLPPGKDRFNLTPDRTKQLVDLHCCRAQFFPAAGLAQNPVGHTVFRAPFVAGLTPIGLVGHDHFLVTVNHVFKSLAVMHVGGRQCHLPDQCVVFTHRHMRLVTIMRLALFRSVTGVPIAAGFICLCGRAARGLQQRRIHQRAGLQNQAFGLQLPVDQAQQVFVQLVFAQPLAEAHKRGLIRHGVLQAQADKAPPIQAVADQLLTLRIAVLEQAHLEKHHRRIRRTPRRRRIHRLQRLFNRLPIQGSIQQLQKAIGRGRDHQAVQKSKLRIGRRLHISRTLHSKIKFQDICRDSNT